MSFNDKYLKLRKERLGVSDVKGTSFDKAYAKLKAERFDEEEEEDIAPVRELTQADAKNAVKKMMGKEVEEEDEDDRKWFQKGAFEDGYQFGDITKTIFGSDSDLANNVTAGILGIGEKVVDTGATVVGGVAGLFGNNEVKDKMSDFIDKDLYDEHKVAEQMNSMHPTAIVRKLLGVDAEEDSVFGEKTDDLAYSAGQLAGTVGLQSVGVPWYVTTGATSFGGAMEGALKEGATFEEAAASSAISAGAEILSEKLFGGSGLGEKGLINLDGLTKGISNKLVKALADYGVDVAAEGFEEIFSQFAGNFASSLYKEDDLEDLLFSEEAIDGYIESFIGGGVLGGGMNVGNVTSSIQSGKDYRSGLTANEEAVVNKVYEDRIAEAKENGETLTAKEKDKIYEEVVDDLNMGFISIEDIEGALGGDTYMEYKNTLDEESELQREFDELGDLKKSEFTAKQDDRYNELKQKLEEIKESGKSEQLKAKLGEDVFGLAKGSLLENSYNERANRGHAFEADLNQYDAKQQEIVKKAIDSGILNNSSRTHQFVDIVAKISADKGVSFDFVNNAKLKESGFALDGKVVNGFVTKDGISINIDSPKAWQSTVGHEITHVLEGTELYTELQNSLFEYAETKGDLKGRRDALAALYDGVEGADVDAELTADLVGDYLFTDSDFINNLSTKHRNVFQKVYDEIKYLCKVATAGSKEARQLEKVRHAFENAYRESGAASVDTKYSLSDSDGKQLSKEQQDYFKDSKMRDENGNLKVMYHGSQDAGFHVFDPSMSDDDTSLFFVDRNDVAASYSGTTETYAPRVFRSAEDANNFFAEIGVSEYEVVENNGKYTLTEDGDEIATSDDLAEIYEEWCDYAGVGYGDANYKVYLNLTNPLEVDAEGRNWDNVSREFSQEIADRYNSLTAEEKEALTDLAEWEDYSLFKSEITDRVFAWAKNDANGVESQDAALVSAYKKLGGKDADFDAMFSIASDGFSDDAIREYSVKKMNTRDYAQIAKEQGYDGVIFKNIHDNGGYSNGSEGASTVAIAFDSNQIKSVANEKPTGDADIRYSLSENGENVVALEGGAVSKYSLSTWTPETQTNVRENLIKVGYEPSRVDKWIKDTNSVASVIAADKDRLDFEAADNQVMLKDNQEYIKTLDASTLCAKRLVYQGTFDAIQHRMPDTMLSSDDLIDLLNMMKEHGIQTPCGVCYVESRRRHLGKFAQDWLNSYKGEYKPHLDEVTTSDGLEALRKTHPQTYKDFVDAMNKKGSSNPKVVQLRTEYRNEIMSLTPSQIRKIEAIGGLRVQSFSDFETPHMLDMMQAVMDMSAKGLHSQAYTKVPNFAWVFGDTGIKINLSLIAEGDGFDADGNLVFSSTEGMDIDEAMRLRDAYSKNVGTIIVGANDKHILACMADDRIDFIIPFHRSGWGMRELEMMGMDSYTDYTTSQKEYDLETGKAVANLYPPDYWDYALSGKENAERYLNLCARTGRKPKFSQFLVDNGDGSYSLQPDGSTDGYWKTLIDFKMYDNEGNGAAQQKVQPNFNMEEAYRVLGEYEGGANTLPVANDVVEEFVAKYQAYDELAPAMSLSAEGESQKRYGSFATPARDLRYESPVRENVAPVQDGVQDVAESDALPDDFAPIPEDVANGIQDENMASLTDADAPPETEAPFYGEGEAVTVDDPFEGRDIKEVGNRKVKAYMFENPEVKPFFQAEANVMLGELRNSTKGERFPIIDQYDGYIQGYSGVQRNTSQDIAYLLDECGYTYDEIEKGLRAIIEDNGAENNACSKRIEFLLNDRLLKGNVDFETGMELPPNQEYIDLLNEKQITEYNEESFKRFMETADQFAPPVEEDIGPVVNAAPVSKTSEGVAPPPSYQTTRGGKGGVPEGQRTFWSDEKTAEVYDVEPETAKKKNRALSKFRTNFVDKGSVFEDLSLKTKNRELMGKYNYMLYSEGRAQHLMGEGTSGVKALNDIREVVESSGKAKQFYEYMYHMHNIDRMSLNDKAMAEAAEILKSLPDFSAESLEAIANKKITEKTPEADAELIQKAREYVRLMESKNKPVFGDSVTAEVSRDAAARLVKENPEFKAYAEDVYTYLNHLRSTMVESGVISQETADLWAEMYPHYVPVRRLGDEGLNVDVPLFTGRTGVNAPVKRATGGNRDILPLFDTIALRTEQTFKANAKNRFGVELMNTLGTTIEREATNVDEAIDSVDQQDGLLQAGKDGRNPTFTVFENGERVTFEITEDMYDALKPTSDGLLYRNKLARGISNAHRGLLTEYNPVFMFNNAIKDAQDILINSQHPVRTYMRLPKAVKELATKGRWYTEYMENGGEQNTYFDGQTKTFKAQDNAFKRAIGMPLRAMSAANNFVERMPRLAEYIASREAGQSIEVAMLDSARVTTNFAAGGDVTKFLNGNGATFLNASVQGAAQQIRNVREAKSKGLEGWVSLAARTIAAGLPALLLNGLLWDDDEDYEELSDYVKQNYYVVAKYGDGQFVRIPKGRTLAVIQDAFEQMGNLVTGNDEVDMRSFVELAISNLAPNNPIENNILAPIIQAANNETWYGDDLVPTRLQDLPSDEQFDESTDSISRWLGESLGVSPYKVNYLLDQYSGGVGDVFLPMLTPGAERGDDSLVGNMIAPLKDKFSTDSVMKNQNVSDFYDTVDELTTNAKSSKATDEDILMYKYMNTVNAELGELYAEKREIQNSDLANDEKYAAVRDVQDRINAIARESLETYWDVHIDNGYASIGDRHFRLTDDGEWQKITDDQLERQEEVTSGLGISPSEYWNDKDEYCFAYDYPEKYAFFRENGITYDDYDSADEDGKRAYTWAADNPGKYTLSKAVTDDLFEYRKYTSELYDLKADKDEDGKTINGSAKEKKKEYIFGLDLDYGQKIILYRSLYDSKEDRNTYNADIVQYLDSRDDISYEEMKTILEELGMKMDANGWVTWD